MNRREFLDLLMRSSAAFSMAGVGLSASAKTWSNSASSLYDVPVFGSARLLHITDTHAQLNPIYFREPNVNLGFGTTYGRWPHKVGKSLLSELSDASAIQAHALTYLNFEEAASRFGKVGGFAHLKTLIDQLRASVPDGRSLLLDGGDTWQGSGTAYWTRGQDMVEATNKLGVDIMTGHWEFTYLEDEILANVEKFNGTFVAQNTYASDEALFDGVPVYDDMTGHVFKPYDIKTMGEHRVAVIGQAFPYTPIANPKRFIPNWTFGIRENDLADLVDEIRANEEVDAVILLSHNGMDVDLKLASQVSGIDVILGGHTHDGVPVPVEVKNSGGVTLVTNAGSNGKFVGVLDLDLGKGRVKDYRYRLLPVFSELLTPDPEMASFIDAVRAPYLDILNEELAVADSLLYRRGNFNGTFDQVICDALRTQLDAQISLSPGFRWGTTVLPGETITMDRVMDQTCMTYPETYAREMSGENLKAILEDVADNLFNSDPYYQQGGDMVRCGGLNYVIEPQGQFGARITDMTLDNGEKIEAGKNYKVAGWATVGSQSPGAPIWDVVADYLRDAKTVKVDKINTPVLKGVKADNPGIESYLGKLA